MLSRGFVINPYVCSVACRSAEAANRWDLQQLWQVTHLFSMVRRRARTHVSRYKCEKKLLLTICSRANKDKLELDSATCSSNNSDDLYESYSFADKKVHVFYAIAWSSDLWTNKIR
jgi:hypothetical protein